MVVVCNDDAILLNKALAWVAAGCSFASDSLQALNLERAIFAHHHPDIVVLLERPRLCDPSSWRIFSTMRRWSSSDADAGA